MGSWPDPENRSTCESRRVHWQPTELVAGRRVQCAASNSMGGVVGPVIPVMAFQGAGPLRCGLGMRRVMTVSGLGEFESGEVRSEAVVNAAAERKHGRRPPAGDVEAVGVVVDGGEAVGGGGVDNYLRAGRHPHAAEFEAMAGSLASKMVGLLVLTVCTVMMVSSDSTESTIRRRGPTTIGQNA